jgi:hypothetical protein
MPGRGATVMPCNAAGDDAQKKAGRHHAHPLCRPSCCEKKETYFFLFFATFFFATFFAFFFAATAAPPLE